MYSGIKDPKRWLLTAALAEAAERTADAPFLTDADGARLSYGQAYTWSRRAAGFFQRTGIEPRQNVGVWMFNGCSFAIAWMGLGYLNATAVFLNTELRAGFLVHQLVDADLQCIVVDPELFGVLIEVADQAPKLETIIVAGGIPDGVDVPKRWSVVSWPDWTQQPDWTGPGPRAQDIAAIMYTSGTSGPSKGVMMPHAHCALYGIGTIECVELTAADRYYISLPFFHANALFMQLGAVILVGGSAFTRRKFSASNWLSDVREQNATVTNMLGVTSAFVLAQPPTDHDRDHRLRVSLNAPNVPAHEMQFHERFGIRDIVSGYGMTENNIPIWGRLGHSVPGAAGWTHTEHFEVCIADPETDMPVPAGQMGEILVRPRIPFGFMAGYFHAPEKTVGAWRNLWFHTGDAGTMTEDGLVTFIDRIRDCIRRRGHNISSSEVEAAVAGISGVAEVAAYPVPSEVEGGEDEVMLAIVAQPGVDLDARQVGMQAKAILPGFAEPRFIRIINALPKTATGKVQRAVLSKEGRTDSIDLAVRQTVT